MTGPSVFVSYAHEHFEPVQVLAAFLTSCNQDVRLDEARMLPVGKWDHKIKRALCDADFVVQCLSQRSVVKRGDAWHAARIALDASTELPDTGIDLIPVLLEACEIPDKL